jgi:NAD(P)-dependent dehydrogenase (short-subunit alcohol dehydrogenase family)
MSTAIITGGSRGFGRALATDLVGSGWHVVLDGRHGPTLDHTTAELGPRARAVAGDVGDPRHLADLVAAAERLGRLDLLVNNASDLGPSPLPRLAHLPPDRFEALLRTNTVAPLRLIQAALPLLRRSGGAIVNVTSDAGVEAYEGWGGYGATKAALDQLGRVLAAEEPEVRVWSFDPGDMRTTMHQAAFPGEDISDRPDPAEVVPALRRLLADRPPSGRVRAVDRRDEVAT